MLLSARVLTIEDFFRLGTFTAASVQRDYVWDGRHAEELFNDIDRACASPGEEPEGDGGLYIPVLERSDEEGEDEPAEGRPAWHAGSEIAPGYHLGEVMLCRLNAARFEIFDGLQRATTLTILLCVMRDLTSLDSLRSRIQGLLEEGALHRVLLPGADRTLIEEILTKGAAAKSFRRAASDRGRRIRGARNIFYSRLKNWEDTRFLQFAEFLLERTFFVVAETDSQLLARQVFITSNQRGIFLRPIDIFKGQIFDIPDSEQSAVALTRQWDELVKIAGDDLGELMRAFDFIHRKSPQGPDHLTKLADYIEKNFGPARLAEVLTEIRQYASAWQELHWTLKQSQTPVDGPDIWRLGFFKWFEWKPLALAWLKDYRENVSKRQGAARTKAAKIFESRFEKLHRACMIVTLAKFSAVDREKIFGNALKQWGAGRDPFSARGQRPGALTFSPRQLARAAETLGTPLHDDEVRLPLIRWLETMLEAGDLTADAASASVEHVLPQRPALDSQWLVDFPNEEERFSACNSIGNLALMDYAENAKITNLDFSLKLPALDAQSRKYKTLVSIADKTGWRAAEIRERASQMIELACTQLNIPRAGRA